MTFMSAPLAFNNVEYECRKVCQPIRLVMPTFAAAGDVMSPKGLSPEGKLPLADWTGENPVGWLTESSSATPSTKSPNQTWIEWNRLLGCFCFARADCLFDNRSQDANLLSSEVDVSPL
jgi:hypothetical protein